MSKNKPFTLHKAYNVYKNTVQSSDVQSSRRHLIKIKWIVLLHTNQVNINTSLYYIERYDKKMSIKKHTHKHIYTTCTTWNFFFSLGWWVQYTCTSNWWTTSRGCLSLLRMQTLNCYVDVLLCLLFVCFRVYVFFFRLCCFFTSILRKRMPTPRQSWLLYAICVFVCVCLNISPINVLTRSFVLPSL